MPMTIACILALLGLGGAIYSGTTGKVQMLWVPVVLLAIAVLLAYLPAR